MNIVILSEFAEPDLELIRSATPDTSVHYYPGSAFSEIPAEVLACAEVLYTPGPLPGLEAMPKLKWVQAHSAGVDHIIDHPLFAVSLAAGRNRIQLTTASGVHAINMSEFILMMMLALAHQLPTAFRMKQQARWNTQRRQFLPQELHGATLGLIGYGAIARQTAWLCRSLDMRVLAMRRGGPVEQSGVVFIPRKELHVLLGESDFIVITTPLTRDTYRLIDASALAAMKRTAYLVNISRGDVIDEDALVNALQAGQIAGAALDVFTREPLPDASPLWKMENVILTPHIAGVTPNYEHRAAALFANNLKRFTAGQPLINKVDFARGY